jgi:quercetin dioxygenase-like cupin family protein
MRIEKHFLFGNVNATVMDFPEIDDTLPMHEHGEVGNHFTVVARGSFMARGVNWHKTLVAGDVIDWPANQPHEFSALEPNSRLVNIIKS